jgi:hypothetical protein
MVPRQNERRERHLKEASNKWRGGQSSSTTAVYAALIGDLLVAACKTVAAVWTGSAAMPTTPHKAQQPRRSSGPYPGEVECPGPSCAFLPRRKTTPICSPPRMGNPFKAGWETHLRIEPPSTTGATAGNGTERFPSLQRPRIVPSNRGLRLDGPPVFPYSTANSRKISQALRRARIVPCVYGLFIARQRGRRCRRCRRKWDKIAFWKNSAKANDLRGSKRREEDKMNWRPFRLPGRGRRNIEGASDCVQ